MYTKFDVQQLMHDVAALKAKRQAAHAAALEQAKVDKVPVPENEVALAAMDDLPLEWEVTQFGLAADVRDPVSGKIFVVCRPEKEGQALVLLTADKVDGLVQDAHKTVLAARMKAAEKALAEAKAKADKAKADKEAAAAKAEKEADAAKAPVMGRGILTPS
jgi:membrane protein involved in colicin uptake